MGALTIVYVALSFSDDSLSGPAGYAIWAPALVFLVEFAARCYDARDRSRYVYSHWLDLVTAVPVPGVPGLRVIRLLRLLRFMKVGVLIRRILLERGFNELGLIWPTMIIFWIGSAIALWLVEHDAPGSTITTFPDAMTAAFLTAATLGFGKHSLPITQDGQIVAAVIVFFALGLWGFASSNLTRMWLNAKDDHLAQQVNLVLRDLERMAGEIKSLTDTLTEPRSQSIIAINDRIDSAADRHAVEESQPLS